jgi:hypothetical protein
MCRFGITFLTKGAIQAGLSLASAHNPFTLTVFILGGAGFLALDVLYVPDQNSSTGSSTPQYLACRTCHNLTYTSAQQHDVRLDRRILGIECVEHSIKESFHILPIIGGRRDSRLLCGSDLIKNLFFKVSLC